jgi:NAD(P)-dependent dehydrogenase (short-subunit alcohol dehydrogenase family)
LNNDILVTGCNGGLGRQMVIAALTNGDSVFATSRHIDPLSDLVKDYPDRLRLHPLDVTSSESIQAAFETCANDLGRIDIVVNNAAVSVCGELEGIDLKDVRSQYEINVFGAIAVTQKAIAHFRRQGRGGKIFQMSSLASLGAFPGVSVYASAKHALTGLSASVAGELDPVWNIKIIILEAGAMRSLKPGHLPSVVWGRRVEGYDNIVGPFGEFMSQETVEYTFCSEEMQLLICLVERARLIYK